MMRHLIYIELTSGQLRGEEPMQVVSGHIDKPTVANSAFGSAVKGTIRAGIKFISGMIQKKPIEPTLDPLLRAAISHFWFKQCIHSKIQTDGSRAL